MGGLKTTAYFRVARLRPGRESIEDAWIRRVMDEPEYEELQPDERIRRWGRIPEAGDRYLRVVLLPDGKTVHNAFFDRRFRR